MRQDKIHISSCSERQDLTLRDKLALGVVNSFIDSQFMKREQYANFYEFVAESAYKIADAMIEERKK